MGASVHVTSSDTILLTVTACSNVHAIPIGHDNGWQSQYCQAASRCDTSDANTLKPQLLYGFVGAMMMMKLDYGATMVNSSHYKLCGMGMNPGCMPYQPVGGGIICNTQRC